MPSQNPLFIKIGKNLCKIENICYFCKHINAKTMKEPINTHPMQQQPTAVRKASMMAGSSQLGGVFSCRRGVRFLRSLSRPLPIVFVLLILALTLSSCEKSLSRDGDSYPEMQTYYTESCSWDAQVLTSDSLRRFRLKVADYVSVHPDAKHTTVYPKIQDNIRQASLRVTLTIDPTWGGDTVINY